MRLPLEKDVQKVCREWLAAWGAVVVRVNSGGMKVGTRFVRFNDTPGCSDTLVCLPDGKFLALELKRPGRDTTAARRKLEQQSFRDLVVKRGGLALVARSLDELKAALAAAGYDTNINGARP